MLVRGDADGKSDVSISKDKETFSLLNSIFLCIKRSRDAFDAAKSKVGWFHAIIFIFLSCSAIFFLSLHMAR